MGRRTRYVTARHAERRRQVDRLALERPVEAVWTLNADDYQEGIARQFLVALT